MLEEGENVSVSFYQDLRTSLFVSAINLVINLLRFRKEAKFHGMKIAEYGLSIFQLSEIPIAKLVPRLPAIKKGLINKVNFSNFQFDRESFAPLLNALSSKESRLETIKLSVGSITNLDVDSCKVLGRLLYDNNVNIIISRAVHPLHVQILFESIDTGNTGYVTQEEFITALIDVNKTYVSLNKKQKERFVFLSVVVFFCGNILIFALEMFFLFFLIFCLVVGVGVFIIIIKNI